MDDAEFNKACLRIHGYNFSSDDEGKSESDEESRKLKPPPIPYEDFKDKIIRIDQDYATTLDNAVTAPSPEINQNKKKKKKKKKRSRSKKNIAEIDNLYPPSNVPNDNSQEFVKEIEEYLQDNRNNMKDTVMTTEGSATAYNLHRSVSSQFAPNVPDRNYITTKPDNSGMFVQHQYGNRPVSNSLNNLDRFIGILNTPIINPGRNVVPVVEHPSATSNAQRSLLNIESNRFMPNIPTERDLCSSIRNFGNFGDSLTRRGGDSSRSERSSHIPSAATIIDIESTGTNRLLNQNTIIQMQQNESATLPNHDNDNIFLFERDKRSCCCSCNIL